MSMILRIIACVLFGVAAFGIAPSGVLLIPGGLFCWCLSTLVK